VELSRRLGAAVLRPRRVCPRARALVRFHVGGQAVRCLRPWRGIPDEPTGASQSVGRARATAAAAVGPADGLPPASGGGKFCVARMFDLWCRGKSGNDYLDVETFAVLTGVEVVRGTRGALRMIRHKSRRYSVGCTFAELL